VLFSGQPLWASSGISFIDSTKISVCHNRRIGSHKVMAEFAARGKTSVDWFYGFKLHLVINDQGELLGVKITAGNVDDRDPVPELGGIRGHRIRGHHLMSGHIL
jgi:hypothetical protein